MDNSEYDKYKWLDAQELKPIDKEVGSKRQEQHVMQKFLEFMDF